MVGTEKVKVNIEIYGHPCRVCGIWHIAMTKEFNCSESENNSEHIMNLVENSLTNYLNMCHEIHLEGIYKKSENEYIMELYINDR